MLKSGTPATRNEDAREPEATERHHSKESVCTTRVFIVPIARSNRSTRICDSTQSLSYRNKFIPETRPEEGFTFGCADKFIPKMAREVGFKGARLQSMRSLCAALSYHLVPQHTSTLLTQG
jgi:hypothetical protein